jgi:precorrin-6B methylase 2
VQNFENILLRIYFKNILCNLNNFSDSNKANTSMTYFTVLIVVNLLVWIPWLWRYRIKPYSERKKIWQSLSNHPRFEDYKINHQLFQSLYNNVNTGKISLTDRKNLDIQDDAFIYGEIEFISYTEILNKVAPQKNEVFCDLGSGAGKAVLTAALNFDLAQSIGVELLPGLCELANKKVHEARSMLKSGYEKIEKDCLRKLATIKIFNQDLLNFDISHCDIVFINATCFHYSLWDKIQEKLLTLKAGSRVICTSKKIQKDIFKSLHEQRELMSWGMNSVNIYKKIQ